jgi:hypothetical protein
MTIGVADPNTALMKAGESQSFNAAPGRMESYWSVVLRPQPTESRRELREPPSQDPSSRWQRLALDQTKNQFSGQLPVVAGGFYSVEIKATNPVGQPTSLTVQHIAVGEVFVVAG